LAALQASQELSHASPQQTVSTQKLLEHWLLPPQGSPLGLRGSQYCVAVLQK
jgi:hypothetical protein